MPRSALPNAHPTAVISDEAVLAPDVKVGAFALIEGAVTVGPGCVIHPYARLIGPLTLGAGNEVHSGAVLGGPPQHLGYKGEPTAVEVGEGNIFREGVTVHRGMPAGAGSGVTRVGSRNLFMVNSHIAHDCVIGDNVVFANGAVVGGHVTVGDRAFLSGNSAIHQVCRVGRLAFVGGLSASSMDVPPFWVIQNINYVRGVNLVGMRRAGLPPAERDAVRKAFRILYLTRPTIPQNVALTRIEAELGQFAPVRELLEFIRGSKRGIPGAHRYISDGEEDDRAAA